MQGPGTKCKEHIDFLAGLSVACMHLREIAETQCISILALDSCFLTRASLLLVLKVLPLFSPLIPKKQLFIDMFGVPVYPY